MIGKVQCRLALPRAPCSATRPVHVSTERNTGDARSEVLNVVECHEPIPARSHALLNPPTRSNGHMVLWTLKRNVASGLVVETIPALAACTAGNTNAQLLGATSQAKSALYYCIKYMAKDNVALTNSLTLLQEALNILETR